MRERETIEKQNEVRREKGERLRKKQKEARGEIKRRTKIKVEIEKERCKQNYILLCQSIPVEKHVKVKQEKVPRTRLCWERKQQHFC